MRFLFVMAFILSLNAEVKFPDPYQDAVLEHIKPYLPEAPVIIEAGGHLGEDTLRMKGVWPNAVLHVFEPLPSSFDQMKMNLRFVENIFCYPFALSTHSGSTLFYIDVPNNAASSIGLPVDWNAHEFDLTPIEVPCITLDEFSRNYGVKEVDFMWLDMEGHELYALQRGEIILSSVKAIFTEISFEPIRQGSNLYKDLRSFLEANGFEEVWASTHEGRFGDALFIRKELLE